MIWIGMTSFSSSPEVTMSITYDPDKLPEVSDEAYGEADRVGLGAGKGSGAVMAFRLVTPFRIMTPFRIRSRYGFSAPDPFPDFCVTPTFCLFLC
jgi:hypothetical protein